MTELAITYRRLLSQRLAGAPLRTPDEVVSWLGLVQAQDYAGACWALGTRMKAPTESAVEQAYASGSILRTHILRPTWHFVTPADIRWMLRLTEPRVHALNGTMYRRVGLEPAIVARANDIMADAVAGGNWLTRDELRETLEHRGIDPGDGMRLAYIVMSAELDGVLCSGPRRGKQFTYALLDERAPAGNPFERAEALAELATRYFASRGPATVQDFAKWSTFTLADAKLGLEATQGRLDQVMMDDGREYWQAAGAPSADDASSGDDASSDDDGMPPALMLSIYDELVSSYKDHSAILTDEIGSQLWGLGNDLYYFLLVDSQVVGTWKRTIRRSDVVVHIRPFAPLSDAQRQAVGEAAQRYGAFLARQVVLDW
jgi:hypothetical protein